MAAGWRGSRATACQTARWVRVTVPRCAIARRYGACVRWGPVVASILAAVALVAAAFTGIVVTADGATTRFGVVRLEGLVGETLLLVAVLLPVMTALFARRLASFGVVLGLGVDTFRRHEIPDALRAKIRDREAARLDTRRYFFAMNPEVGDPWIAAARPMTTSVARSASRSRRASSPSGSA